MAPPVLSLCESLGKGETEGAGGIKVSSQLASKQEIILSFPSGLIEITKVLKDERVRNKGNTQ